MGHSSVPLQLEGPSGSLGARAVCANVTDHLIPSCRNVIYSHGSWNCSLTLANSSTTVWFLPNSASRRPLAVNPARTSASALVYKMPHLVRSSSSLREVSQAKEEEQIPDIDFDTKWEAIECSIEPVVQSVRARVEDNIFNEDLLASWADIRLLELLVITTTWIMRAVCGYC
jgi:hypothetical protein